MRQYDKAFKEEAVRLSDEIGTKKAAEQLGIPYFTLQGWRKQKAQHGDKAFIGSGRSYASTEKTPLKSNWKKKSKSCGVPMKSSRMRSLFSQKTGSVEDSPYLCLYPSTAEALDRQGNVQSTGCQ